MDTVAAGVVDARLSGGRPARWAATGRSGGVSRPPFASLNLADYVGDDADAVRVNRARLATALGVPADRLVVMDAVHGSDVAVIEGPGAVAGFDALVTQAPGLAIAALGADCVPLALIGDDDRTIAVAHCGWRGLVGDVVAAVVGRMSDLGCGVGHAILGPAVCGTCYPVPEERADAVSAGCPSEVVGAARVTCADGQPGIDVRRGVAARLATLGVASTAVVTVGGCTVEDSALFSYRRDKVTGRQGIAVARVAG